MSQLVPNGPQYATGPQYMYQGNRPMDQQVY